MSLPKRILIGSYYVSGDSVHLKLVNCSSYDANNLERMLGRVIQQQSVKVHRNGREEPDQYLVEWCEGPGWSNSRAKIYGDKDDITKHFSRLEVEVDFPGSSQFLQEVEKQYEFRAPSLPARMY